jgi:hypothetical protein
VSWFTSACHKLETMQDFYVPLPDFKL